MCDRILFNLNGWDVKIMDGWQDDRQTAHGKKERNKQKSNWYYKSVNETLLISKLHLNRQSVCEWRLLAGVHSGVLWLDMMLKLILSVGSRTLLCTTWRCMCRRRMIRNELCILCSLWAYSFLDHRCRQWARCCTFGRSVWQMSWLRQGLRWRLWRTLFCHYSVVVLVGALVLIINFALSRPI